MQIRSIIGLGNRRRSASASAVLVAGFVTYFPASSPFALAQAPNAGAKLEYVLVLSRHGARSGLMSEEKLNEYSSQPWRPMTVPIGYLTAHGRQEMQMMGAWDRQYLEKQGLISGKADCGDASRTYFRADSIQRDVESARAVSYALFPDCKIAVHSPPLSVTIPEKKTDPMFLDADTPGVVDRELAGAALEGRLGGDPRKLLKAHAAEVEIVQKILSGPGGSPKTLLTTPLPTKGDRYERMTSPVSPLNNITDALLLEYEEGYPMSETGWGRLNETNLPALLTLQEAFVDAVWDNPVMARARGSNLLAHMLRSLQQEAVGHVVEGAMGNPGDKALFILGHDSDFGHLATLLGLSWILDSFPPKATPPGAEMMFELWREADGHRTVRLSIVGQTIQQIHDGADPTKTPPMKVAVFIPGCSTTAEGFPCDWDLFRKTVENTIDFGQVRPESPLLN